MNTLALLFGLLFFLNPTVGIIDILPDFIGALLLLLALREVHFLSEKIENATPKLWGLFAVSVVKTMLAFVSGGMGGSTRVFLAFAFAVGEGLLLLNIISPVASGMEALKIRYGTIFAEPAEGKKRRRTPEEKFDISNFKTPLCVYTVFRLVMCFLPEATELRISKPSSEETGIAALSEFRGLLYGLILPIVCIFMIFAVIRTVRTVRLYGKDKIMLEAFHEAFLKDKADFPTRHKRTLLKKAYVMFMIAAASCICFYADNKDMIPKVLAAAAFAVLIGYFGRNLREKIIGFSVCGALAVSSLLYYAASGAYFSEYVEGNAAWLEGAMELYRPLCIVSAVQAALMFALLLFASVLVRRCALEVFASMDDTESTQIKMKKFKRQITVFRLVSLVFCVAAALYAPLRPTFQMILTVLIGLDVALVLSAYFVDLKL
ncbi:MAG: hypothetical protein E7660_05350 [Ruminococcaceae bacterium]|nr:hypothetical protein [Oscillospiraceae bacterium]